MIRAIMVLVVGMGLWEAIPRVTINEWSMLAAQAVARHGLDSARLERSPTGHKRAPLWRGRIALAAGENARAVEILQQAAEQYPQDALLRSALGDAYEAQGQLARAVLEWKRIGAWREMINGARSAIQANRWEDALFVLEAAGEAPPEETVSYQAQALNGIGNHEAAIVLLRRSLAAWPRSAHKQEWLLTLGESLGQEKLWAEAATAYRQAVEIDDGPYTRLAHIELGQALYFGGRGIDAALQHVQRGVDLNPQRSEGYFAMGDLLRAEKRYLEASEWYRQSAEKAPDNRWTFARWAESLVEANQSSTALGVLDKASRRFPDEPHFHYLLSLAYRRLGDIGRAIEAAEETAVLARAGNVAAARMDLARLYEQAGRMPEAIQVYRSVLEASDGDASAYIALGKALYRAGDGVEAAAQFRRAVEMDPESPAGYAELGQLYQSEKRYREAEGWYRQAVERSPNNVLPWALRGENALQSEDLPLAGQVVEQMKVRFPGAARTHFLAAQVYRKAGDSANAVAAIQKAASIGPIENVWDWLLAGGIYEWAGEREKALQAYQNAAAADGSNRRAREALERMRGTP